MKPKRKLKKGVWITLIVIGVILGVVFGGNTWIDSKLNKIKRTSKLDENQANIADEVENKKEETKITNLVLFGADNEGNYTDMSRTDAIKIVSFNDNKKTIKISSIQRDTIVWIPDPVSDYSKWNHAYWWGGPELALRTLNMNLDLDLTEYVTFSFMAVQKVVDEVDGINLNLSPQEVNQIPNAYRCKQQDGTYHLNGKQAMKYMRIRYIDSDFTRMQRQNNVMIAIKNKLKGSNFNEIMDVVDVILPYIQTNLSNTEIKNYITSLMSYDLNHIEQYKVPEAELNAIGKSISYGGYTPLYVLKSYADVVEGLHKFIYGDEKYEVSKQAREIEDKIYEKFNFQEIRNH